MAMPVVTPARLAIVLAAITQLWTAPGERDDRQGPALQPAIGLFFAGGKEAIEINVQLFRGGGLPHPRTIANK